MATRLAVIDELCEDDYIYRYAEPGEPLGQNEGAFLICNFWMSLAYLGCGETTKGAQYFERTRASCSSSGFVLGGVRRGAAAVARQPAPVLRARPLDRDRGGDRPGLTCPSAWKEVADPHLHGADRPARGRRDARVAGDHDGDGRSPCRWGNGPRVDIRIPGVCRPSLRTFWPRSSSARTSSARRPLTSAWSEPVGTSVGRVRSVVPSPPSTSLYGIARRATWAFPWRTCSDGARMRLPFTGAVASSPTTRTRRKPSSSNGWATGRSPG